MGRRYCSPQKITLRFSNLVMALSGEDLDNLFVEIISRCQLVKRVLGWRLAGSSILDGRKNLFLATLGAMAAGSTMYHLRPFRFLR